MNVYFISASPLNRYSQLLVALYTKFGNFWKTFKTISESQPTMLWCFNRYHIAAIPLRNKSCRHQSVLIGMYD